MLYAVAGVVVFVLCLMMWFFLSKKYSPVPYFPTQQEDIPEILDELLTRQTDAFVELGAGTGTVLWPAVEYARKKGIECDFLAFETNPVLWGYVWVKSKNLKNQRIRVINHDYYSFDWHSLPYSNGSFYSYPDQNAYKKTEKLIKSISFAKKHVLYKVKKSWE